METFEKKIVFFSKKKFLKFFFEKIIFLESRTMPKNSKRGHSGSLNVFTNRKLQKNARGYRLIESENFRKKSRIVPKKKRKKSNERKPLVSHLLLEAEKICGLVRESNPRSPASQKIS